MKVFSVVSLKCLTADDTQVKLALFPIPAEFLLYLPKSKQGWRVGIGPRKNSSVPSQKST